MTTRHPFDADEGTLAPSRPASAPPLPPTDAELGPSPVLTKPEAPVLGPPAPPQTSTQLQDLMSGNVPGWREQDYTALEYSMRASFPEISKELLDDTMGMVMRSGDPNSVLSLSPQKFQRQVGLTTQEMFEERSLMGLLGATYDDETFAQAAIDTFLETGGAARTAATVFAEAEQNAMWWSSAFLEQKNVRDEAIARLVEEGVDEGSDAFTARDRYGDTIAGLRGKKVEWVVSGNELAMRFNDEDEGKPSVDVLIHLEPGTDIETSTDALIEWALADDGLRHLVAPSSGEVTGRQTWIGALIEGTDDAIRWVENHGSGVVNEASKQVSRSMEAISVNPSPTQQKSDEEAVREMETLAAVKRNLESDAIVLIARKHAADNPDASMSAVVHAGIAGFAEMPDEIKGAAVAESISDLEAAATKKRNEQSMLGRFIEEDVAPPVIDTLAAWDAMIHFIGITVNDFTNLDSVTGLQQKIAQEGVGALTPGDIMSATMGLVTPGSPDLDTLIREFDNIKQEGLPLAVASYTESVKDIGDLATYYGIDEDSSLAAWVNIAGSVAYDPITYATLGGAASWNGLKKGVTTVAGAERLVQSRPVLSMARNIVQNDTVRVLPLLSADNMSSNAIARLAMIAKTRYATKAEQVAAMSEVKDILFRELPANGGMWIPSGPARVLRRKTTAGISNLARLSPTDTKSRSFLRDILVRSSRKRYASTNERSFLNDFFHWAEVRRASNADGFADDIIAAVERYEQYRGGVDAEALLTGRLQKLNQEISSLVGMPNDIAQVPKLRKTLKAWNDELVDMTRRVAARRDLGIADDPVLKQMEPKLAKLARNRDRIQSQLDELSPGYDDVAGNLGKKRAELKQVQAQLDDIGTGGRDRSLLEQFMHEYMDDWAEEIGIPIREGVDGKPLRHRLFPHLPQRDWSVVVGDHGLSRFDEAVGPLMPFGDDADALAALGMRAQAGVTPLPVSAHELLAYATMNETKLGAKAWKFFLEHPGFKAAGDNLQAIWSVQVLGNLRTMFRSHLDETVRFYEDVGMNADVLKATSPVGGASKVGPEGRAFARDQMDSFLSPGQQSWQLVLPSEKGMWVHAERWINGTLMQDPIFKAFARAVTNGTDDATRRALWEEWWNETGVKLAKRTTINGSPITGSNSYDIMERSFGRWLDGVVPSTKKGVTRQQVFDDMIAAAASGKQVTWDAAVFRQLPSVPAQISTEVGRGKTFRHAMDSVFQVGYGNPQQRRGAVFYDHYYEWARSTYRDAHGSKIIDEDWLLANGHATSRLHAQELMNQGRRSQVVRNLINDAGMMLDDDIQRAAMNWAAASADDMMYTFGAASMFGRKLARIYPFGRAQTDYLQWWWKKLTQPTQLATGHQIPGVNIRLIDRMGHLANLGDPNERPGAMTPAGVVNNFTFLPTVLSDQILMETTPSLGPIAGWTVNLPLDDVVPGWTEARNVIQELHPSHRIFTEPFDGPADAITGAMDALFPSGGLSVRNQVNAAWRLSMLAAAYLTLDYDPSLPVSDEQQQRINSTFNTMVAEASGGPWRNDRIKTDSAQWLNDNAFDAVPTLDPASDVMKDWSLRNDQASRDSLMESTSDFFGKIVGVYPYDAEDYSASESLLPVDQFVDQWVESGSISDAKRDAIMVGHDLLKSGESTMADRRVFADEVLDSLFSLITDEERIEFLALNPGVHVNLVSYYEVQPDLVPDNAADAIVNGRIKTADIQRARDLRTQGREEGWAIYRDDNEVRYDELVSTHRSFREYLDIIYERAAGIDIGTRSIEIDGKKVSTKDYSVTLTPEWWDQHKDWLGKVKSFKLPPTIRASLESGNDASIRIDDLREVAVDAKRAFSYQYTVDANTETRLNRIGLDDRPMSSLGHRLSNDFIPSEFFTTPTSHYGQGLMDDFRDALDAGQRFAGWQDMTEWENDWIIVPTGEKDESGQPVTVKHSLDDLRSRFRIAIAISASNMEPGGNNYDQFTEKDYANSTYGRNLGELDWQAPQPPPLAETAGHYEAPNPQLLHVVDGDTIEIQTDDGPVFVRLLGLNAPEQNKPGYRESLDGLAKVIEGADTVHFAVWEPNRYGLKTTTFAKEENAIVHRDRLLVWLYVDGVPLFDPSEFSQTNIRGVRTGGTVPDYQALLDAQKGRD